MRQKLVWLMLLATLAMRMEGGAAPPQRDDCWGSDQPCADGKYRDHLGNEQPASCNNNHDNAHACHCAKDTTALEQCPETNMQMDMSKCKVYCREDACGCITVCDFNSEK